MAGGKSYVGGRAGTEVGGHCHCWMRKAMNSFGIHSACFWDGWSLDVLKYMLICFYIDVLRCAWCCMVFTELLDAFKICELEGKNMEERTPAAIGTYAAESGGSGHFRTQAMIPAALFRLKAWRVFASRKKKYGRISMMAMAIATTTKRVKKYSEIFNNMLLFVQLYVALLAYTKKCCSCRCFLKLGNKGISSHFLHHHVRADLLALGSRFTLQKMLSLNGNVGKLTKINPDNH